MALCRHLIWGDIYCLLNSSRACNSGNIEWSWISCIAWPRAVPGKWLEWLHFTVGFLHYLFQWCRVEGVITHGAQHAWISIISWHLEFSYETGENRVMSSQNLLPVFCFCAVAWMPLLKGDKKIPLLTKTWLRLAIKFTLVSHFNHWSSLQKYQSCTKPCLPAQCHLCPLSCIMTMTIHDVLIHRWV